MIYWLLGEIIALYFISHWVTKSLFVLFLTLFRSRTIAVTIILILQFPGTVIHELAHLFVAEILRVPTGKLTLVPESIREGNIRSGSVTIAQSDPFRRYAIGIAPLFAGMLTLSALAYLLSSTIRNEPLTYACYYLLFTISNTMFPSPEDLKGFVWFVFVIALFIASFIFLGVQLDPSEILRQLFQNVIRTLSESLAIVIGINIGIFLISWIVQTLYRTLWSTKKYRL